MDDCYVILIWIFLNLIFPTLNNPPPLIVIEIELTDHLILVDFDRTTNHFRQSVLDPVNNLAILSNGKLQNGLDFLKYSVPEGRSENEHKPDGQDD